MEDSFQKQIPWSINEVKLLAKKKLIKGLILGGIFFVLVILGSIIYFWYHQQAADNLIKLAPIDSILYICLKEPLLPSPVSLIQGGRKNSISELPLTNFYNQIEKQFDFKELKFKDDILANVSSASFILLPNRQNNNLDSVLIFELKKSASAEKIKSILKAQPYYLEVDENILVVATSLEAIEEIKAVKEGLIFSLATQVDLDKLDKGLLRFYLDADNLKSYLNQSSYLPNKIFVQLINQDIYLSLNQKNNQWQFDLEVNSFSPSVITNPLVTKLPNNFKIYISSINLAEVFNKWGEFDQNFSDLFKQTLDGLRNIYGFDFKQVMDFFDQNVDLLVFDSGPSNIFGLDYVLLLPEASEEQIQNLKKLVQIILAQKLPKPVDYFLPDGTKVTELLADVDNWQWQADDAGINYLIEPVLNFEISYLVEDGKIIISSSRELLKSFINDSGIRLSDLIFRCDQGSFGSRYLIFNKAQTASAFNDYWPLGTILIKESASGQTKGCIIDL